MNKFIHSLLLSVMLVGAATAAEPIRTIYLVRHGAYDTSKQTGDETSAYGLVSLGIAEARLTATRLRSLPIAFDSLVSSTYTRARQTADVINRSLPQLTHQTDPLLCECRPRTLLAKADKEVPANLLEDSEKQLNAAFAKYFVPAKDHEEHDIIVAHGNVIRWFVLKALGVDTKSWSNFSVAHCSLTIVQVKPDGTCRILSVGDTGHIPPNLQSGITPNDPQLVAP